MISLNAVFISRTLLQTITAGAIKLLLLLLLLLLIKENVNVERIFCSISVINMRSPMNERKFSALKPCCCICYIHCQHFGLHCNSSICIQHLARFSPHARMRSQARLHIFYIPAQFLPLFFTDSTVFIWTTFYGH